MQLSQKESELLKEMKNAEKVCAERYKRHRAQANDPQLADLLGRLEENEREHFDLLTRVESGELPQPRTQGSIHHPQFTQTYGIADSDEKRNDCFICSDLLAAEKHSAGKYNTTVFEFRDPQARQLLNRIQTEQQQHGLQLYGYMSANGMY